MAEWWQDITSGKLEVGGAKLNLADFESKAGAANAGIGALAHSNPTTAAIFDSLPGTMTSSWITQIANDPSKWQDVLQQTATAGAVWGLGGVMSLLSKPKGADTANEAAEEYDNGTGINSRRTAEAVTNQGYPGFTRVLLGPLEFEVPPAMSTVASVHGATGTIAPGAGPGITVRHIQNFSTMLIPGSVPLYQSLGIQGQMLEFVGAFLGFDHKVQFDAHKHFVGPTTDQIQSGNSRKLTDEEQQLLSRTGLKPGESQVYSELSPDPFYLPNSPQANQVNARGYLGYQYGLSTDPKDRGGSPTYGMGNLGAWAISRAFEMQIRRGVPLRFVLNTGIVTIKYDLIVVGFERLYQRDDRTWYKIQGMIVGSTEVKRKRKGSTGPNSRRNIKAKAKAQDNINRAEAAAQSGPRLDSSAAAAASTAPAIAPADDNKKQGGGEVESTAANALAQKIKAGRDAYARVYDEFKRLVEPLEKDIRTARFSKSKPTTEVYNALAERKKVAERSFDRSLDEVDAIYRNPGRLPEANTNDKDVFSGVVDQRGINVIKQVNDVNNLDRMLRNLAARIEGVEPGTNNEPFAPLLDQSLEDLYRLGDTFKGKYVTIMRNLNVLEKRVNSLEATWKANTAPLSVEDSRKKTQTIIDLGTALNMYRDSVKEAERISDLFYQKKTQVESSKAIIDQKRIPSAMPMVGSLHDKVTAIQNKINGLP